MYTEGMRYRVASQRSDQASPFPNYWLKTPSYFIATLSPLANDLHLEDVGMKAFTSLDMLIIDCPSTLSRNGYV